MLTKSGVATLIAAIVVLASGRLFGLPELFVLGSGGLLVLVFGVAYLGVRRQKLDVTRRLNPARVHAGMPCRVDMALRNDGRFRSPVVRLQDHVSGTKGVDLLVAPLPVGATAQAIYRLPTEHRGLIVVGPLELTVSDPFGLARITRTAERDTTAVVYPKIESVGPPPRSSGNDLERQTVQQQQVAPSGDDFYALREYALGDDLRRVHWPSTARHDELMVRQDEIPWHGRLTLLLDTSTGCSSGDFEQMVSAAGSIIASSIERGDHVRLVTTGGVGGSRGVDTGHAMGRSHLDRVLTDLAVVEQSSHFPGSTFDRINASTGLGTFVVVTFAGSGLGEAAFAAPAGNHELIVARFGDGATSPSGGAVLRSKTVIPVPSGASFPECWARGLHHRREARR